MRALVGWLSASLRTYEADALEEAKDDLPSQFAEGELGGRASKLGGRASAP